MYFKRTSSVSTTAIIEKAASNIDAQVEITRPLRSLRSQCHNARIHRRGRDTLRQRQTIFQITVGSTLLFSQNLHEQNILAVDKLPHLAQWRGL
jgi:hypothetical protein